MHFFITTDCFHNHLKWVSCDLTACCTHLSLHLTDPTHIVEYFIVNIRLYSYTHFKEITCMIILFFINLCDCLPPADRIFRFLVRYFSGFEDSKLGVIIHSINPYKVSQPIGCRICLYNTTLNNVIIAKYFAF